MNLNNYLLGINKKNEKYLQIDRTKSVENLSKYYMEFHHKCITWFITIFGFLIAGVIATPNSNENAGTYIFVLLTFSFLILLLFLYIISVYSSRIHWLREHLEEVPINIPKDWRTIVKKEKCSINGKGDLFFIGIMVLMFLMLFCLSCIKFFI
mgnify:CR=1 FL=1